MSFTYDHLQSYRTALETLGIPADKAPRTELLDAVNLYASLVQAGLDAQACHTIALLYFAQTFASTSFIGGD